MEDFEKFKIKPQIGDILMTRITAGIIGDTAVIEKDEELGYYVSLALIRKKAEINSYFLNYYINSPIFKHELHKKIIHVAFPKKINLGDIGSCYIKIPILTEQEKIASFLTSIDNLISTQESNISILETYNRGLKMDILSQKIRFKDDSGNQYPDWEKAKLDEVFIERNTTQTITSDAPLLSFTIEDGVINPKDKKTNKRDFLIKDIDNKKFSLTEYNDIIYNPANLKFGAIHRNKLGRGVVSPIYAIFYTKENPVFMEYVVTNPIFIKKSLKYLEGTVIKLMTLKPKDFLLMDIYLPCLEEQEKIANFLTSLDNVLQEEKNYLEYLKTIKKGLLQQMFV